MNHLMYQEPGRIIGPSATFPILFIVLALSAFILWRRARSRRILMARVSELEDLSAAGRAISTAQLDVTALCHLIARQASTIMDTSTFQIGTFENGLYEILYWTEENTPKETPISFDLTEDTGLISWIKDNKHSFLIHDIEKQEGTLPAKPVHFGQLKPRSGLFIPLISGTKTIGLISAFSQTPRAFNQRDLGRLTILANQAAAAIANARIYEQERTRAAQLELVAQIAQQVNIINDIDELFEEVVQLTKQTFGFGSVDIYGIEAATGRGIIQASSVPVVKPGTISIEPGHGIVGTTIRSRQTTISNRTAEDERYSRGEWSADTQSEIAVPLIVEDELVGVMDFQSPKLGAFSTQERVALEALGNQVAVAILKAKQFARQRRQSWITTAQLQVAEAIGQSADLETLTTSIVRLTSLLTGVDYCAILLWDEDFERYHAGADYGSPKDSSLQFQSIFLSIGDWPALDAVHVGQERMRTSQAPPWMDSGASHAFQLLPLVSKGESLGILVVSDLQDSGENSEDHNNLLRNIAVQIAHGIDSIQLQIAQQEEAWVNTALLQVAEAINHLTDLNEILDTIVRMLPLLVGVRSSIILIWDEVNETFRAGPSHGLSEMGYGLLESFDINLSEFPLLSKQDMARIGPDATYYTFELPDWMRTIMESKTADIFPLYARARLVGALIISPSDSNRPLAGRRLNIVSGIAQQAAIAVVNHQLYQESAEKARLEQELNVARSIQASLIPYGQPEIPECTIDSLWEAAREVSGDFYDFLQLSGGKWGIAIADVADKGMPAALFMALSKTILRTVAFNRIDPADVLARTNRLIFNDTTSDLFVTVFYAVWDPRESKLTYASGGHNPPILVRSNGDTSLLIAEGIALGVLDDVTLEQKSLELQSGDTVVFYTDGVTEAMNEDFDEFGMDRLCRIAVDTRQKSAEDTTSAIRKAIQEHAGDTPQFDDITLVVLKR